MEITPNTKLFDLLAAYPELEEQIMNIAPPFRNLKNPVLRRTVGKVATLEKVAQVGGMDPARLVNTLRKAAGQSEWTAAAAAGPAVEIPRGADNPEWIAGEPQFTIDGMALLERGEVPLGRINADLERLETGRFLFLETTFEPAPILDAMRKQGRRVHHAVAGGRHLTFIA